MNGLLLKFIVGHFRRHRLEALLCLVGVALGVAVVVAIDAAVAAAVQSFGGAVESLAERSTHSIFADTGGVPDSLFLQLLHEKLPGPIAPMIDREVLLEWHGRPAHDSERSDLHAFDDGKIKHVRNAHATATFAVARGMSVPVMVLSEATSAVGQTSHHEDEDRFAPKPDHVRDARATVGFGHERDAHATADDSATRGTGVPHVIRSEATPAADVTADFRDERCSALNSDHVRDARATVGFGKSKRGTIVPLMVRSEATFPVGETAYSEFEDRVAPYHERDAHVTAEDSATRGTGVPHVIRSEATLPAYATGHHEEEDEDRFALKLNHVRDARATQTILARLIGVDVFSERSLRSFTSMQSTLDSAAFNRFMTEPGAIVLVQQLADRLHVKTGDDVQLTTGSGRKIAHVIGTFEPTGVARSQLDNLIVADLSTAQELTGTVGFLDRIDTELTTDAQVAEMTKLLPPGYVLRSTRQRAESLQQLVQAYRLNLNALSLMASFVAVFIVYNSMLIGVQQRATSLGILRCLGASRPQLAAVYLLEAGLYAIVGGAIGVLGGWLLSRVLVGYISTTINDLYAAVRPGRVTLDAAMWAKGLAVAVVSCAIGAAVPMVRASRTPPVNAFRGTGRSRAARGAAGVLLVVGAIMIVGSYGVYKLPGDSPIAGFVIALLVALGFALVCPWATRWAASVVDSIARKIQAIWLQMAAGGVGRSLGITGVAVAATMLAIAMNISVRTMVASFRGSLADWLGERFAADVFVAPELLVNHKVDATIDPAVRDWVLRQPETLHVDTNRSLDVPVGGKPALLFATDVVDVLTTLPMKLRESGSKTFDLQTDVLISEPLAGRTGLTAGSTLTLPSPTGPHRFGVFGVFYDFGTERGQLMIDQATYAADWNDAAISSLHVKLKPGLDRTAVADRWATSLRPDYPVVATSFDQIKVEAMTVFDRTFKVTEVLTWLSGGVAFCGLAGSLLALALARQRDYAILAAVGMSSKQTAAWVVSQGLLLAWISAAVAPVAGTLLAYVLAYVIQYRSFGWSIPTHPQPRFWLQNFWIATAAALVAAVYPILRLRRISPAASLGAE